MFESRPEWRVVRPGSEVVLRCSTNLPTDSLLWLHNHHALVNSSFLSIPGESTNPQQQLQEPYIVTSEDKLSSSLQLRLGHRPQQYQSQLGLYQVQSLLDI